MLVTSRERLRVQGEHVYPGADARRRRRASGLFLVRARALDASGRATTSGRRALRAPRQPAARARAGGGAHVVSRRSRCSSGSAERLDLLTGGRDGEPRQQTLRATIEWSYGLLEPDEQRLFARLSVFARLHLRSGRGGLWRRRSTRSSRCSRRACFAARDAGDRATGCSRRSASSPPNGSRRPARPMGCGRRHAEFFAAFAERADPHLRHGPDQQGWVERVAADYDNVRAAMSFALEHDLTLALRLVGRTSFFVWLRGGFAEAQRVARRDPAARGRAAARALLGRAHECAAVIAERLGDIEAAGSTCRRGLRGVRRAWGMSTEWPTPFGSAERPRRPAVMPCGRTAIYTELAELAERIGDRWNGAIALNNLGDTASQSGDWERAVELCGRSSVLRRELGDEWGMALALCNVAIRRAPARQALVRRVEPARRARDEHEDRREDGRELAASTSPSGLRSRRGRMHEAARLAGATSRLLEELGSVRDGVRGGLVRASGRIRFARRSAPTRKPRSSAGGSCRSTRRRRLRSPQRETGTDRGRATVGYARTTCREASGVRRTTGIRRVVRSW